MIEGRIIKGIGGFYYVDTKDGIYECHARGLFRQDKIKPLVGDIVDVEAIPGQSGLSGSIVDIHERKNRLIRPEVSNADEALIIFALKSPDINFKLLDSFIIQMSMQDIPVTLVFNKKDLEGKERCREICDIYEKSGARSFMISARAAGDTEEIRRSLSKGVNIIAGPSGVGKSTVINALCPDAGMETGEISRKLKRGRNTTKHSELFRVSGREGVYVMDTPGFSSFTVPDMDAMSLKAYYPEFFPYEGKCRFNPCSHTHEPDCAIRDAASLGMIPEIRYMSYSELYGDLLARKRYQG